MPIGPPSPLKKYLTFRPIGKIGKIPRTDIVTFRWHNQYLTYIRQPNCAYITGLGNEEEKDDNPYILAKVIDQINVRDVRNVGKKELF